MTPTENRSFDIIVATSATDDTPRVAETIEVEVYLGDSPEDDFLTPASSDLIEQRRAYHMGRTPKNAAKKKSS